VNLSGPPATATARWQSDSKSSVPSANSPSTTAAGLARNFIASCRAYASISLRPRPLRVPAIGRTKYSIIPLVSGWFTSKRYSSPSVGRSIPACRCVSMTTRVASISACSLGSAASQSGTG